MNKLFKKGDVVKTSLSDSTLVLRVEKNDALLFDGRQFIVAQGVQKENDEMFWNQGDYYDELPDNVFQKDNLGKISEEYSEQGKGFSYERFCEYVRNKMSTIYENDQGEYRIYSDTQPLQQITPSELGMLTEEETLRYIYENNLFQQLEEVIKENPVYFHLTFKEYNEEFEDESENYLEDEEDWELEP